MPAKFEACIANGGRVKRKTLSDGRYINICFPKGGGPGIAGEVHEAKGTRLKKVISGK